jgi:hypothetical protein
MTTSEIASHSSKQPVVGVLLVHGLNGSRHDLGEMEAFLHVTLPLFPQQCSWRLAQGSVDSQLHAPSG